MRTVPIHTKPPYEVLCGAGLLQEAGARLKPLLAADRIAVVCDDTVAPLYLKTLHDSLAAAGFSVSDCVVPAGEAHKNFATLQALLERFAENGLTRRDAVAALGGGVIGDMAGFAAGVYMRGIRYVQFPTTLLAAVDSSVGGKTAIDLASGKNLAGLFLQPSAVLCDTDCLATLSPEILADGAAEAIKTGVLDDETLFALFEERPVGQEGLEDLIARCVLYKAGVVERDERELFERKLLNLGHTAAHSIEYLSGYTVAHGHAVAAGLAIIARAADRLGWSEEPVGARICACLEKNHLPTTTHFSPVDLAAAAARDKKRGGDQITLVVPRRIGACDLRPTPLSDLTRVFSAGLEA